jgi:hypothetical protein
MHSSFDLNLFFAVASLLLFTLAAILGFRIYYGPANQQKPDKDLEGGTKFDYGKNAEKGRAGSTYISPLSIVYEVSEASISQIGVMSPEEPQEEAIPAWIKTVRQSQLIACPPRSETIGLEEGKTANLAEAAMVPIDVKRKMEDRDAKSNTAKLEKPVLVAFKNNRISQLIKQEFEQ